MCRSLVGESSQEIHLQDMKKGLREAGPRDGSALEGSGVSSIACTVLCPTGGPNLCLQFNYLFLSQLLKVMKTSVESDCAEFKST